MKPYKKWITSFVALGIIGVLMGCASQESSGSVRNNKVFQSISQSDWQGLQSAIKTAGYQPKLPTYYPYTIKHLSAKADPGTGHPNVKQNIAIVMGDGTRTFIEHIFFGKTGAISTLGTKTELKNGTDAYFSSKTDSSSLVWNSADGHSYGLESMVGSGPSAPSPLSEKQLVNIANSMRK